MNDGLEVFRSSLPICHGVVANFGRWRITTESAARGL